MGIVASEIGLGADVYRVANQAFRRIAGGLGMATVAANALFASITGSSIASASVFTRIAVPEMLRFGYTRQFSVGVVAGSFPLLGMLIPPSSMLIIYAIVAEQSVGHMFVAGVVPGILLALAFMLGIFVMTRFTPNFVGDISSPTIADQEWMTPRETATLLLPVVFLVILVLGGIYTGWFSPEEAGAAGSAGALAIGIIKRRLTCAGLLAAC